MALLDRPAQALEWVQRDHAWRDRDGARIAFRAAVSQAAPAVGWGYGEFRWAGQTTPDVARRWPRWLDLDATPLLLWWEPRADFSLLGLAWLAELRSALPIQLYLLLPGWLVPVIQSGLPGVTVLAEEDLSLVPANSQQLPLGDVGSIAKRWPQPLSELVNAAEVAVWRQRWTQAGCNIGLSLAGGPVPITLRRWLDAYRGAPLCYQGGNERSIAGSGWQIDNWCGQFASPNDRVAALAALQRLITDQPEEAAWAAMVGVPVSLAADSALGWPWPANGPFSGVSTALPPAGTSNEATTNTRARERDARRQLASPTVARQQAAALYKSGKARQAAELLAGVLQHGGATREDWLRLSDWWREAADGKAALQAARLAIRMGPDSADGHVNLGNALQSLKRFRDAMAAYQRALSLSPDSAFIYNNLGVLYRELGELQKAEASYRKTLEQRPDYHPARMNLGNLLRDLGRFEESLACYQYLLKQQPANADAWFGLGNTYKEMARPAEAIAAYQGVLKRAPQHLDAQVNLSLMLMLSGELGPGNDLYMQRFFREVRPVNKRPFRQPWWDGGAAPEGHLLVWGEQGAGDKIMFSRLLPEAAARVGKMTVEGDPRMLRLLQRSFPDIAFVPERKVPLAATREATLQTPIGALARWFRRDVSSYGDGRAYFKPDAVKVAAWKQRLQPLQGLRVGLVWAGSPTHQNDRNRSLRLEQLASLWDVPGCSFVSLQVGGERSQLASSGMDLFDPADEIADYDDTAALIANLDLVIGVDTSVMHLTGALGVPGWVMLPFAPDWRWMMSFPDSTPWYGSLRLFRQRQRASWDEVIAEAREALAQEAQRR